ncbi:MAG TPA: alpha/beta fold hydrolase [Polyangiaceae bacterium]|jgi:pimeloyl-ACP methyl ester carboxylesterase
MSPRPTALLLALSNLSAVACTSAQPPKSPPTPAPVAAPLALTPCTIPDLNRPAKCGTAHVFENRASQRGRTIALKVVVVPAAQSHALPDPVVVVAGGPGEAATDEVPVVADFVKTSATRDFVFVDQRGMGRDSPLRCKLIDGTDVGRLPSGELSEVKLRACLAKMDADPALYTTAIAADDLDEVLASLGYSQANVLGFSYGTFATQTFAHAHPGRARTLILDGVAPPDERFVLGFAVSSQAALEQTFAECAADAGCHAMHPDPKGELARAFARLDARAQRLVAEGPEGKKYPVMLDHESFALALRNPLYSAPARGRALAMIHDVAEGRFDDLAVPLLLTALGLGDDLSVGAYLSIACAESVRGVTIADAERSSAGTFLGTARAAPILNACKFWPTGGVPAWLHEPVTGEMPALLFGGTVDPATPLAGLEEVRSKLKNAQAVVVPGAGHDVGGECMDRIVAAFLDHPLVKVDPACVKPIVTHFARPAVKVAAATLDHYTGRFAIEPKFVLTVEREGEQLTVQATGQGKLHLDAESETRFRVREIEATLDFEMGGDGRAKRVVLHQGTRDMPGERVE